MSGPATCRRCATAVEPGDLRCATCGLVPTAGPPPPVTGEVTARVLRCDGCGVALQWDAGERAVRCAFAPADSGAGEPPRD